MKLLWDDGPHYRVSALERRLPLDEQPQPRASTRKRPPVSNWRKMAGRELAYRYGVRRSAYSKYWNQRHRVVQSVWGPMVKAGASLEQIEHALADCPAFVDKINDRDHRGWERGEIERIEKAMEK